MLLSTRFAIICLGVLCCTGCGKPLSQSECDQLLDRYVGLLLASDRPGTPDGEIVKLQAEAREKAAKDPAFRRCSREVSRRQFECAMQAPDADHLEQCML